jgi:hypothetical protein
MSFVFSIKSQAFVDSFDQNVKEVTDEVHLRIMEILGFVEELCGYKLADVEEPDLGGDYECASRIPYQLMFLDIDDLRDPANAEVQYTVELKSKAKDSPYIYDVLGRLQNSFPAFWLFMEDSLVKEEIAKVLEERQKITKQSQEMKAWIEEQKKLPKKDRQNAQNRPKFRGPGAL